MSTGIFVIFTLMQLSVEEPLSLKRMEQLSSLLGESRPGDCQCMEMSYRAFVSLLPEKWNILKFIKDFYCISVRCMYIATINLEIGSSNKLRELAHLLLISFNQL